MIVSPYLNGKIKRRRLSGASINKRKTLWSSEHTWGSSLLDPRVRDEKYQRIVALHVSQVYAKHDDEVHEDNDKSFDSDYYDNTH